MQAPGARSRSKAAVRGAAWAAVVVVLVGQGSVDREVAAARAGESLAGQAGMRVALQPESGDFVPAGALPADLNPFAESAGEPEVKVRPDGGLYADLDDRYGHYVIVRRTTDGRIVHACTNDHEKAQALVTKNAPVPAPAKDARGWEVR